MPRRIAFLIYPQFQLLDAAGPLAAFEIAARIRPGTYELQVVAVRAGAVRSSCGAQLAAQRLPRPQSIDTLIVCGGDGSREALGCARTRRFIQACAARAQRLASVCSGAFLLAGAGLLDGRSATTHWSCSEEFRGAFPQVRLDPDRIFVRDGRYWSSAGITAGIDLSLALIGEDLGEKVARRTAQHLVVYQRRPGGQSQFSALLEIERKSDRVQRALSFAKGNLRSELSVEQLAEAAALSPRQFSRLFVAETGRTPAKAVEQLRLEAARLMMEEGRHPIETIARETGFADRERMRRAFVRAFGQPPQAIRRSVAGTAAS